MTVVCETLEPELELGEEDLGFELELDGLPPPPPFASAIWKRRDDIIRLEKKGLTMRRDSRGGCMVDQVQVETRVDDM